MAHLLNFHYNDWTLDEFGKQIPAPNCAICGPLDGHVYIPGSQPQPIPHDPAYSGDDEIVYHCACFYVQSELGVTANDPNHTHPDLVQQIRDLNVTELQRRLLDLGAATQAVAETCGETP